MEDSKLAAWTSIGDLLRMPVTGRRGLCCAALALLALPGVLLAQGPFSASCTPTYAFGGGSNWNCAPAAQTAMLLQPRIALAAAGGDPVPGDACPLGWRHFRLDLRADATRAARPPLVDGQTAGPASTIPALSGEAVAGVFDGFSLLPTVTSVGSLDLFGTVGVLPAFGDWQRVALTAGAGARLGVMRESGRLPGISISAAIRSVAATRVASRSQVAVDTAMYLYYQLPLPSQSPWLDGYVAFGRVSNASLRAVADKRLRGLGLDVGIGWDEVHSSVELGEDETGIGSSYITVDRVAQQRLSAFGDVTWSLPRVVATAELGWQSGAPQRDALEGNPTGYENLVRRGAFFGGVSLRPGG